MNNEITVLELFQTGIYDRGLCPYSHIFQQRFCLVCSFDKTPAVGTFYGISAALFLDKHLDLVDPGLIIHLETLVDIALICCGRGDPLFKVSAQILHGLPESLPLSIL